MNQELVEYNEGDLRIVADALHGIFRDETVHYVTGVLNPSLCGDPNWLRGTDIWDQVTCQKCLGKKE